MADGIAQLQRHFGHQVDKDVLASVLDICGGDVQAAITFLTAGDGQIAANDPAQQRAAGLPPGFMPSDAENLKPGEKLDIPALEQTVLKIKKLFQPDNTGDAKAEHGTLKLHNTYVTTNFGLYATTLLKILHAGIEISKASRSRVLACCWFHHIHKFSDYLLQRFDSLFQLPEILKALQLLDAGRRIRAFEKKLARLEAVGCRKKKLKGQLRTQITDLRHEVQLGSGSVSGALCSRIRKWVKAIPASKLSFYALALPTQPWKDLADIVHLKATDFALDWFLHFVFGKVPAPGTVISVRDELKKDGTNLVEILQQNAHLELPYSFIRSAVEKIPDEAKALIAKYTPLDALVWYHEELGTPEVNQIIKRRLEEGKEKIQFGYGKLMERLLYFKRSGASEFFNLLIPLAGQRLQSIKLDLEAPVVVFGDASYSMDVAVRTATIISSVVTLLADAELKFFHTDSFEAPKQIKDVNDVIEVAEQVKADKLTAPACALWPYYQQRKIVKCFIVVTDEVENEKSNGEYFHTLFAKYYSEVYPAKLVFVSFLENPGSQKGRMVTALEKMGAEILQFRLDGVRPDLTKLSDVLGLLACDTTQFASSIVKNSNKHFVVDNNEEKESTNDAVDVKKTESELQALIGEVDPAFLFALPPALASAATASTADIK